MIGMNYHIHAIGKVNTINALKSKITGKMQILNFRGHVYVPTLMCVKFNDIHLLFLISAFLLLIVLYFCMFLFESMQELILKSI